ncbi:hypothetical protein Emag_001807 [Eimeria magna]
MRVTVTDIDGRTIALELAADAEVQVLKELVAFDLNIPVSNQLLILEGVPLRASAATLADAGITEHSIVLAVRADRAAPFVSALASAPSSSSSSRPTAPHRHHQRQQQRQQGQQQQQHGRRRQGRGAYPLDFSNIVVEGGRVAQFPAGRGGSGPPLLASPPAPLLPRPSAAAPPPPPPPPPGAGGAAAGSAGRGSAAARDAEGKSAAAAPDGKGRPAGAARDAEGRSAAAAPDAKGRPAEAAPDAKERAAAPNAEQRPPAAATATAPAHLSTAPPTAAEVRPLLRQQAEALLAACAADQGALGVLRAQSPEMGDLIRDILKERGSAVPKEGADTTRGAPQRSDTEEGPLKRLVDLMVAEYEAKQKLLLMCLRGSELDQVDGTWSRKYKRYLISCLLSRQADEERRRRLLVVQQDPLSLEAQQFLLDQLHEERVNENYSMAREHLPEGFGQVCMLYVHLEINGVPCKAFVDSGAQQSILSLAFAESCSLSSLIDKRFAGLALGVGQAPIIGRVHLAPLKIGSKYCPCSFIVLDDDKMQMMLGLDMLKRYQMVIDLKKNALIVEDEEIPFLSEAEIDKGLFGTAEEEQQLERRTREHKAEGA